MDTNAAPPAGGLDDYFKKLSLFSRNAKIVLTYSALTGLAFGVFRLLFNFYVLSLGGYDETFLGLLTSVSSAASMAMAIPAAYLAERYSQKKIMIVTGLASAGAFLGLVLLPTRGFLILFNIVSGLAQSTRQVTVSPFLMHNTSREERQYVFSFNFGLTTIAGFVGNLVGGLLPMWLGGLVGALPTSTLAYRLALGAMVLMSLLATGPLTALRSRNEAPEYEVERPWTLLGRHWRQLSTLVLPQWIIGLGAGMMMPFMNLYFRKVFERSDSMVGIVLGSTALGMALAQFIAPPIADRIGKINIVVLTEALSVPFLLTLGLAAFVMPRGANIVLWFAIAWGAYLLRTALMNMSGPVYQTFVLERVPENVQALAMSLNGIAFQFGWVLSPQLSGWFQATVGFVPVFLTTAALYVVAIGVTWIFFGRQFWRVQPVAFAQQEREGSL